MEYTTVDGVVLELKPVAPLKIQKVMVACENMFEKVECPKYCEDLPGGKQQCFVHDETSITQTDNEDEIAQWKAHQEYLRNVNTEKTERSTALILYDGIATFDGLRFEDIPNDWREEQEWLGIEIPENRFDLKVHYATTEIFKSVIDLREVILKVREMGMMGVDDDAVQAAMNTFPDTQTSEPEGDNST